MNLSILELLNENYDKASHLIHTSHELVEANLGTNNCLTLLIKSSTLSQLQSQEKMESSVQEAKSITEKLCNNELQRIRFFFDNIDNVLDMGFSSLNNTQLCKMLMFQIIDHPFSWTDFHPLNHFLIFGGACQVWEHLEKLKMEFPSNISGLILGLENSTN